MTSFPKRPPVLILGCGRSGTSIFGEMFNDLSLYNYDSEPDFSQMLRSFGDGKAVKVPIESPDYPPDPGLSFPLDAVLGAFPTTKIFWIVRHPYDAVCSLRVGIRKNWQQHPKPPDWKSWLDKPLIERCAYHWSYINSSGYQRVKDRAEVVYFENLIRSPVSFAQNICATIGLFPTAANSLTTWAGRVQNSNNEKFVEAETSRGHSLPDHTVRVGRWRENLSADEVKKVKVLVETANEPFGYCLSNEQGN